jgi:hypothetical protein
VDLVGGQVVAEVQVAHGKNFQNWRISMFSTKVSPCTVLLVQLGRTPGLRTTNFAQFVKVYVFKEMFKC